MTTLSQLVSLVIQNGAEISDDITVRALEMTTPPEYGIFSTSTIGQSSAIISIPYGLCISVESVLSTKLSCIFDCSDYAGLVNFPDEVIAIGLMSSLSCTDLPWALHVSTMPKTVNSSIFWEEEEIARLSPSTSYHLTKLMNKQILTDWETIHKPVRDAFPELLEKATLDLYKWSLSIIYSRAIGFVRKGNYVRCIPPVLDMANHSPHAGTEAADTFRYDEEKNVLQLVNVQAKQANEECYAVYGVYPNSKLVFSYGFVIPNNPHRAIDLWTRVTSTTSLGDKKQAILGSHPLTKDQPYDFCGTIRPGWVSPALLSTVRVIQCDEEELSSGLVENTFRGEIITVRNEIATYTSLRNLVMARMKTEEAEACLL